MTIATISTYIKTHEKLVFSAIAGLVLWFGIGKIDDLIQNHDSANLAQTRIVAEAQTEKTAALAAQVEQQSAQYQALATKLDTQNAALVAANTQLATALAQRQKTDAALPPSELAKRWTVLVPQANPTVTPSGLAVDTPGAIATVVQLERIPVQQETIKNVQQELGNAQGLLTASNGQVTTLNTEVGSLRVQITDNAKVCDARVKVVTDAARKSKRRWLYAGMVIGFIGRQLIKSETGF